MKSGNHIIQKLTVDVEYNGRVDHLEFENEISSWCRDKLVPYLEKYLESLDFPGYARMDTLEVEVRSEHKENWQQSLLPVIALRVKNRFGLISPNVQNNVPDIVTPDKEKTPEVIVQTPERRFTVLLQFFLREGFLPWWSTIQDKQQFETSFFEWIDSADPKSDYVEDLRKEMAYRNVACRLVIICDTKVLVRVLKLLFPDNASVMPAVLAHLEKAANAVPGTEQHKDLIEFRIAVLQNAHKSRKDFLESIYHQLEVWLNRICIEYELPDKTLKEIKWKKEFYAYASMLVNEFRSKYKIPETQINKNEMRPEIKNITGGIGTAKAAEDLFAKQTGDRNYATQHGDEKRLLEQAEVQIEHLVKELYISNAGLIVVAPLLPTLYKRLNITKENSLTDPALSLSLLHYLVYGNEHATEFLLAFGKVLCGLEIQEPVFLAGKLSQQQKEEADEMLRSVIEYWKVLKDTSIDALRLSFLKRNGKLTCRDDVWHLQVEQQPYDMLLQQLPWSIHMIRLPWMKTVVRTEWIM